MWKGTYNSTPGRIRTCNQRIRNPLLYPLSYGRKKQMRYLRPPPTVKDNRTGQMEKKPQAFSAGGSMRCDDFFQYTPQGSNL